MKVDKAAILLHNINTVNKIKNNSSVVIVWSPKAPNGTITPQIASFHSQPMGRYAWHVKI